ncbi:MAG: glycosyl hydrolase [Bacteroidota bacterium]|nr:glycosyl hydrolase [Bacteroidota bacterium]
MKDVCGDHPAIFGWELGHLELGDKYSLDSVFFDNIINHLLYGYSTDRFASEEEYLERYPGDDLIDLIGFDLYDRGPEYAATLGSCAKMVTKIAAEKGKIVAVTEAGGPITKNPEWWTKTLLDALRPYKLSYVLVWRNAFNQPPNVAFGPYKGCPSEKDFVKFYNDPKTLFLKDIE